MNLDKKLIGNIFWRGLQTLSKQGYLFFITLLTAKLLSPSEFSEYVYILAVISFFVIISDMGISSSITRFYSFNKDQDYKSQTFVGVMFYLILFSIVLVLLAIIFGKAYDFSIEKFYPALPIIIFAPIYSMFDGYFRSISNFKFLSIASFSVGLLTFFGVIFLTKQFGLNGALLGRSAYFATLALIFVPFNFRLFKLKKLSIRKTKEIIFYSLTIGASTVAAYFYSKIDILILKNMGFGKHIGIYELLFQFLNVIIIPGAVIAQVLTTKISRNQENLKRIKYLYTKSLKLLPLLLLTGPIFYVVVDLVVRNLFSEFYDSMFPQALIIVSALVPFKIWGVYQTQSFIVALGKAKWVFYTTLIGALLNVVFDIITLNIFGFLGVLYTTLVIHSLNIAFQTFLVSRFLNKKNEPN